MSIQINPCGACHARYGNDINGMRNCCYSVCAAFQGVENVNDILYTDCGKACQQCMKGVELANGKDLCEYRLQPPPLYYETPRYLPNELRQSGNLKVALKQCQEKCGNSLECKEACLMDAMAVTDPRYTVKEGYSHHRRNDELRKELSQARRKNPCMFWLAFFISAFILSFVLIIMLRVIFGRN